MVGYPRIFIGEHYSEEGGPLEIDSIICIGNRDEAIKRVEEMTGGKVILEARFFIVIQYAKSKKVSNRVILFEHNE